MNSICLYEAIRALMSVAAHIDAGDAIEADAQMLRAIVDFLRGMA